MRSLAVLLALAGGTALAQELPPGHPMIGGGGGGDEGDGDPHGGGAAGALPPGHPMVGGGGGDEGDGDPHGGNLPPGHPMVGGGGGDEGDADDPHAENPHGGGRESLHLPADDSKDAVEEDRALPAGTIEVRVVAPSGDGIGSQRVEIVILKSDQSRETMTRTTGADGRVRIDRLATGDGQAYRVYAPYRGARYGAEPFQLSADAGTRATLTRWPVTNDTQKLLLFRGRTVVEFGEEGMKVTGHMGFMNFGGETIVPEGGTLRIPLPGGARAFQTQPVMTDQKLSMDDTAGEEAVLVQGSFPPGEAQIFYGYQMPLDGTEATLEMRVPFRVVVYDVIVEKAPGMKLSVTGMPRPEEANLEDGRAVLTTALQRRPGDPPFTRLKIEITGLPGKGAGRWLAIAIVVLLVGAGVWSFTIGGDPEVLQIAARKSERERLLGLAVALERERTAGKTDDTAYERRRERLLVRLAEIYRAEG